MKQRSKQIMKPQEEDDKSSRILHFCALKNRRALWRATVYRSGGGAFSLCLGNDLTMMIGIPMTTNAIRAVHMIHHSTLRLKMMQPRSTYLSFFWLLSCGPSSQLCCVSSSCCRYRAARSKSMLRLCSSSVTGSTWISNDPPHWFPECILVLASTQCMRFRP